MFTPQNQCGWLVLGWGALAGVKLLKLCFATMERVCSGFFASSTLKHTPGAHRSACDPPQYASVRPNAINPLIRHPALKPGTHPCATIASYRDPSNGIAYESALHCLNRTRTSFQCLNRKLSTFPDIILVQGMCRNAA